MARGPKHPRRVVPLASSGTPRPPFFHSGKPKKRKHGSMTRDEAGSSSQPNGAPDEYSRKKSKKAKKMSAFDTTDALRGDELGDDQDATPSSATRVASTQDTPSMTLSKKEKKRRRKAEQQAALAARDEVQSAGNGHEPFVSSWTAVNGASSGQSPQMSRKKRKQFDAPEDGEAAGNAATQGPVFSSGGETRVARGSSPGSEGNTLLNHLQASQQIEKEAEEQAKRQAEEQVETEDEDQAEKQLAEPEEEQEEAQEDEDEEEEEEQEYEDEEEEDDKLEEEQAEKQGEQHEQLEEEPVGQPREEDTEEEAEEQNEEQQEQRSHAKVPPQSSYEPPLPQLPMRRAPLRVKRKSTKANGVRFSGEQEAAEPTTSQVAPSSSLPQQGTDDGDLDGSERPTRRRASGAHNSSLTGDERRALGNAISSYGQRHNLSDEEINGYLTEKHSSFKSEHSQHLWAAIFAALPTAEKSKRFLKRKVLRFRGQYTRDPPWDPESDQQLVELVDNHGHKWALIGAHMDRNSESCRDRYRNHAICGNNKKLGKWTDEEDRLLLQSVAQVLDRNMSGTPVVDWIKVSALMDGHRSRQQCMGRWDRLGCDFDNPRVMDLLHGAQPQISVPLRIARMQYYSMNGVDKSGIIKVIADHEPVDDQPIRWSELDEGLVVKFWSTSTLRYFWWHMRRLLGPKYENAPDQVCARKLAKWLRKGNELPSPEEHGVGEADTLEEEELAISAAGSGLLSTAASMAPKEVAGENDDDEEDEIENEEDDDDEIGEGRDTSED